MQNSVTERLITRFMLNQPAGYDLSHQRRIQQVLPRNAKMKQAGVLIAFVKRQTGYHVVLTQRAKHLKHHPGQIAFPGGRFEAELDNDLIDTAIRETFEETGIICQRQDILGQLPALPTVSGYVMQPFVATINADYQAVIDTNEVETLFEVPANYLLNANNRVSQQFLIGGKHHRIYSIPYKQYAIWGATAQIIHVLSDQIGQL